MNLILLKLINEIFFNPHKAVVSIDEKLTGSSIKNNHISFGCTAGTNESEISNLFHEMAHFIICPEKKLFEPGWGLTYKKMDYWTDNYGVHQYPIVETTQDVQNEINVLVWQLVFHRVFEPSHDPIELIDGHISALKWLEGWNLYRKEMSDVEAFNQIKTYILQKSLNYSFKDFYSIWNKKVNYLKQNQRVDIQK